MLARIMDQNDQSLKFPEMQKLFYFYNLKYANLHWAKFDSLL